MKKITISILAILLLIASNFAISDTTFTQTPVTLNANKILPKEVITGSNYQIKQDIINDGLINLYTFSSEHGEIEAEGIVELHMRVDEFNAISVMEEMDRSDVFGESLVEGVKAPVKGVKALATEPVETTKSAAKGIGQFASNIGRSIVSDDPDQDNVASVALGYDVAKRQFAHELDINPYTDNEIARDYLGKISRAAVAGGIVPRVAMAAIDSTAITVARVTGTTKAMKELIRDNPPGKLDKINRKKLEAMGVSSDLAESFLDNHSYDPYDQTILVGELEVMGNVKGRENFIKVANTASHRSVARYYRAAAQMMEAYNTYVDKAEEIRTVRNNMYLSKKDGTVIFLSPVDYVFWSEKLATILAMFVEGTNNISKKEVWVAGRFDENARKQFESIGWVVVENADDTLLKDL